MRHLISKEWRDGLLPFLLLTLFGGFTAAAIGPDNLCGDKPWSLVFVLALLSGVLASQSVSGELESGTLHILLTRPISRKRVWLAKYLATGALVLGCALVLALVEGLVLAPIRNRFSAAHLGAALRQALTMGLLTHAIAFFVSTQLAKRLDSMLWGMMASAFAVVLVVKSIVKVDVAALALTASLLSAAASALLAGGTLDSWKKHAAGLAALGAAAAGCVLAVLTFHVLETHVLPPVPESLSSFRVGDDGIVLATFTTKDRPTNLFNTTDSRVVRIDLGHSSSSWLPDRWCVADSGVHGGTAWASLPDSILGYPLLPAEHRMIDAVTGALRPEADASVRDRFYLEEEAANYQGSGTALMRRDAGTAQGRKFYSQPGVGIKGFWPAGNGVAVLTREDNRGRPWTVTLLDETGLALASESVPGTEREAVRLNPEQSVTPPPGGGEASIWMRASPPNGDGESWILLCTDGKRMSWSAPVRNALSGGIPARCSGGILLAVLEGKLTEDWRGSLLKFDDRGNRIGRIPLGEHVRVSNLEVTPDGSRAVVRLEHGPNIRPSYLLLDAGTMATRVLLQDIPIPGRACSTIQWVDGKRLVYAAARALQVMDVEAGPGSIRTIFSF